MLNLISVNIEGKRHLDKIERLLEQVRPDVVCMQEVFVDDVSRLSDALARAMDGTVTAQFTPIVFKTSDGLDKTADEIATGTHELIEFGNLIMTVLPATGLQEQYYYGDRAHLRVHRSGVLTDIALVLSSLVLEKDGATFQVATTHFCKNHEGSVTSDFQREQVVGLLQSLEQLGNFIVCGDFNAPRGGEIFTMLAERYTDNIDASYTSSIDPDLHRAGHLPYMVDGLFTTPEYVVTHMHFETGVSDHYAIVATIERAAQ